jgi:hypothetical protein
MKEAEGIEEPEDHGNDDHPIKDRLDGALYGDERFTSQSKTPTTMSAITRFISGIRFSTVLNSPAYEKRFCNPRTG